MGDITVRLHHDGVFVPNPLKYTTGELQIINDIQFEEMEVDELFQVVERLVVYKPTGLYYCIPGTTLSSGIRELKTQKDMEDFLVLGYQNGNKMDLYTEFNGYDVLQHLDNDNLHKPSGDDREVDEEVDEQVYEDDVIENVEFHTEGEENVVFEKLTLDDPFLTKLVGKGNIIAKRDDPIPPLSGAYIAEEDPENDDIDPKFKIKRGVKYPSYNPNTPWDEFVPILGMKFENPEQLKLHLLITVSNMDTSCGIIGVTTSLFLYIVLEMYLWVGVLVERKKIRKKMQI